MAISTSPIDDMLTCGEKFYNLCASSKENSFLSSTVELYTLLSSLSYYNNDSAREKLYNLCESSKENPLVYYIIEPYTLSFFLSHYDNKHRKIPNVYEISSFILDYIFHIFIFFNWKNDYIPTTILNDYSESLRMPIDAEVDKLVDGPEKKLINKIRHTWLNLKDELLIDQVNDINVFLDSLITHLPDKLLKNRASYLKDGKTIDILFKTIEKVILKFNRNRNVF
ncbi:hypothetical protein BCR36DRAFT_414474 [Piromyces finnis]|uniref:Uncharacterized protein n=1 Tax=Piromyces finnis TaxID=1754191 RepID=A0A1Y1V4C6_9FUNG|nr:hypothetical protein BCR36DRAFT_414474 [Piromyces finnis]|eukprot:ORX45612.1 hypothetical protein BCR36DRAFT_414474 [Piromyces finnis]